MSFKEEFNLKLFFTLFLMMTAQVQALTCEKEYALRSEKETQVLNQILKLHNESSKLGQRPSAISMTYQEKLKQQIQDAKSEIFNLQEKFAIVKDRLDQKTRLKIPTVEESRTTKKQRVRGKLMSDSSFQAPQKPGHIIQLKDDRMVSTHGSSEVLLWTRDKDIYSFTSLQRHKEQVTSLERLSDDQIITGDSSGVIHLWKINPDGSYLSKTVKGHQNRILQIIRLKDNRVVTVADKDVKIWTWDSKGEISSPFQIQAEPGANGWWVQPLQDGDLAIRSVGKSQSGPKTELWLSQKDGTYKKSSLKEGFTHTYVRELSNGKFVIIENNTDIPSLWKKSAQGQYIEIPSPEMETCIFIDIFPLPGGKFVSHNSSGRGGKPATLWSPGSNGEYEPIDIKTDLESFRRIFALKDGRIFLESHDQELFVIDPYQTDVVDPSHIANLPSGIRFLFELPGGDFFAYFQKEGQILKQEIIEVQD